MVNLFFIADNDQMSLKHHCSLGHHLILNEMKLHHHLTVLLFQCIPGLPQQLYQFTLCHHVTTALHHHLIVSLDHYLCINCVSMLVNQYFHV